MKIIYILFFIAMFILIIGSILLSSVVSLIGAFILSRGGKWKESFSLQMTAFAAGVLLTTALLHLAPESIHEGLDEQLAFQIILLGIVVFFVLERMVWWFHHHHEHHGIQPSAWLIMLGDSIHNFIDGATITAAFLIDPKIGIITTLAVGFHEIPQEIADFVTMTNAGMSRQRALLLNFVSSIVAVIGGVLTYLLFDSIEAYLPMVLAFSSGMFLYIALSDLIPELHSEKNSIHHRWGQLGWLFLGILVSLVTTYVAESFIHA